MPRTRFHLLAKPSGPICNLDCAYCYFLEKESLYPGDRFRMRDDVLDRSLAQYLGSQPDGEVVVAWQGGEPTLLGIDFFRRAVERAEHHRRPAQRLRHTIQTNGTLLTEEWGRFLAEHRFLVGISIDGPPDVHDRYRVDKRGRPSSDRVLRGLEVLRRHGVDVNVLCTVHAANEDRPLDVYRYLRDDLGIRFLQLIPIVERTDDSSASRPGISDRSVSAEGWGDFLVALFDEWFPHDVGEVFVQLFDAALASWCGLPSPLCIFRETCGDALVLEHNGDVYSCDHFVEPAYLLGNLTERPLVELATSAPQQAFGRAKADGLPAVCGTCEVRFACHGECPKNRLDRTPDGEPGLNVLCAGYRAFFHHVDGPMRLMAGLLGEGRDAADAAAVIAAAGRNDPCPCGSGRKAKHCRRHGWGPSPLPGSRFGP